MKVVAQRINDTLCPTDEHQAELIETLPKYTPIEINIKLNRNIGNHRRFFAFINKAFAMQDFYNTKESMRAALLIRSGHCEKVIMHDTGDVYFFPKSMKFDEMDELEFKPVFKDCIQAFHELLRTCNNHISEEQLFALMQFE